MSKQAYEVLANTKISTRVGTASMGSTILHSDIIRGSVIPGLLARKHIKECLADKTVLAKVAEAPKAPKTKKSTKKSAKTKPEE